MSKATQKQLELIAALGFFEGKEISKEDAGAIIGSAREQGIKPDWVRADAVKLKILQIMKRRDVNALKKTADANEKKHLEERIEDWSQEIEGWKEDLKMEKKGARERISDFHEYLDISKHYSKLTKKPTKAEVRAVVEALDEHDQKWEQGENADKLLIDTLHRNFEHLRTKTPRPTKGKKKKKSSCGCLLILLVCVFGWMVFNSLQSNDDDATDLEEQSEAQPNDTQIKENPKAN